MQVSLAPGRCNDHHTSDSDLLGAKEQTLQYGKHECCRLPAARRGARADVPSSHHISHHIGGQQSRVRGRIGFQHEI